MREGEERIVCAEDSVREGMKENRVCRLLKLVCRRG